MGGSESTARGSLEHVAMFFFILANTHYINYFPFLFYLPISL